jgi:integrase
MKQFTVKTIENLKPQEKTYMVTEGRNLYVRVSPKGRKTWLYVYAFDGKRHWYKLGAYPELSLADARDLRDEAATKVSKGINVAEEKQTRREERLKSPTVADIAHLYMERWARKHKRSWKEDERNIGKDVLPRWGKRKARDIRKSDVIALLEDIDKRLEERGKPNGTATQRQVFAVLRKMFNFAIERDLLDFNPCIGVKPPPPPEPRKRHLNEDEIKQFWTKLDECGMSDEVRRALKLTLVTGQRPGEVSGLQWGEVDGRWWTLPGERSKNKRPHRVYLTDLALSLLGELSEGPVFPSPRNPERTIENNAVPQAVRKNFAILRLEDFKPHDLRGTVTTQMSKLGIEKYVRERVQNHIDSSVSAKHYDAYDYDAEKRQALEKWSRRLSSIISGVEEDKVVPIR